MRSPILLPQGPSSLMHNSSITAFAPHHHHAHHLHNNKLGSPLESTGSGRETASNVVRDDETLINSFALRIKSLLKELQRIVSPRSTKEYFRTESNYFQT